MGERRRDINIDLIKQVEGLITAIADMMLPNDEKGDQEEHLFSPFYRRQVAIEHLMKIDYFNQVGVDPNDLFKENGSQK